MVEPSGAGNKRASATRSPSYPYIGLREALEKAEAFRVKEGRNPANFEVAVRHWGYSPKSSGAKQTLAALRAFGLVDSEGPIKLTDTAMRYLLDKRDPSPDREALIRKMALSPPMHKKLWERYGTNLPSHANLRHSLIFDDGFNENTVEDFIREYKATYEFARLDEFGSMPSGEGEPEEVAPSGGAMQQQMTPAQNHQPQRAQQPPLAPAQATGGLTPVTFPLRGDNTLEVRLRSKISPEEFNELKDVLMRLLELSIVDRRPPRVASADPDTFVGEPEE